jgi:hypothetical protein
MRKKQIEAVRLFSKMEITVFIIGFPLIAFFFTYVFNLYHQISGIEQISTQLVVLFFSAIYALVLTKHFTFRIIVDHNRFVKTGIFKDQIMYFNEVSHYVTHSNYYAIIPNKSIDRIKVKSFYTNSIEFYKFLKENFETYGSNQISPLTHDLERNDKLIDKDFEARRTRDNSESKPIKEYRKTEEIEEKVVMTAEMKKIDILLRLFSLIQFLLLILLVFVDNKEPLFYTAIAIPWLGLIFAVVFRKDANKLEKKEQSSPFIISSFLAIFLVFFSGLITNTIDLTNIIIISFICLIPLYPLIIYINYCFYKSKPIKKIWGGIAGILIMFGLFFNFSIKYINIHEDDSTPKLYRSVVLEKDFDTGDFELHTITTKALGSTIDELEIYVSESIYKEYEIGDSANILIYPGFFDMPWASLGSKTNTKTYWYGNKILQANYDYE